MLAQKKINKAYQALSIHDYYLARKLFYAQLGSSYKAQAALGLAYLYNRPYHPFHNPDSAAIMLSLGFNNLGTSKKTGSIHGFKTDSASFRDFIDTASFKQLLYCIRKNEAPCFNNYLRLYYLTKHEYLLEATESRDELDFNKAVSASSADSILLFIQTHPQSTLIGKAKAAYDKQLFTETTEPATAESYILFIEKYPASNYLYDAYQGLLDIYKKQKNTEGLYQFVKKYPQAPQYNSAWKLLFTLSVNNYNNSELNNFIKKYPSFPFKNEILKEIELNKITFIPVVLNELIGYADSSGKIRISPQYEDASDFLEGLAVVQKNDSSYYINKENKNVLQKKFAEAMPFVNGLAPVKSENKWYLIDRLGDRKSDYFEEINEVNGNVYVIKKNGFYGAMNTYGKIVLEPTFEKLSDFKNGFAIYQQDNKFGFISLGGYTHKAEFEWLSDFSEYGLAVYKSSSKYGLIKSNGKKLTPPLFDQILRASNALFVVVKNNQYGFYSGKEDGCYLSDIAYDFVKELEAPQYTNGQLLKLIKKNQQSLMDLNGKLLVDFKYEEIHFPANGLMRVRKKNKYGFLDNKMNLAIPIKYFQANDFVNGFAVVESTKGFEVINTKAETILISEEEPERIEPGNYFLTEENNLYTLFDTKGKTVESNIKSWEKHKNFLILTLANNELKIISL